jgi:phosphoribosylamine--glycine ligase
VKADGLAAGKGVLVTDDIAEAHAWVDRCIGGGFGVAGSSVVIEEYLDGPELSVFAVCDGRDGVLLEPARDYKRLADGDTGPNTGGMGSYSPVGLPTGLLDRVAASVVQPVLQTMDERGTPYRGLLYVGLVLTSEGPRVLEFNCRFGDPETQAILPRLRSDLVGIMQAAATGSIAGLTLEWSPQATVNVVLASPGYPENPERGAPIQGLADWDDVHVFHAGTAWQDDRLVTSGGRVLSVVGVGPDVTRARDRAYAAAADITWPGRQLRTDIGLHDAT